MSDIGRVKRASGPLFPSVRKSADPMLPEMSEIDFSKDLREYDAHMATSVAETESSKQNTINEENRNKQFRMRQQKKKEEEEKKKAEEEKKKAESNPMNSNSENFVDIMV